MMTSKLPLPRAFTTLSAALLISAATPALHAAEASSGALGYTTITCLWDSDTLCSAAGITENPDFIGVLAVAPDGSTIQASGTPAWTDDEFNGTHYVRFRTGSNIGRYYPVTDTTSDTLTLDLGGDNLSGVVATDSVKLIRFWTLGTLFPVLTQDTVIPSSGNFGFQRQSEILFPNLTSEGINLSASRIFFLVGGNEWRESTSNPFFEPSDDVIILPDMFFIMRHSSAPGGTAPSVLGTSFVPMGTVEEDPTTVILASLDANLGQREQDNAVAISRPVGVTLIDSDLISSGAFQPSANAFGFARRDELLVFDLDVDAVSAADAGINRAAINRYFFNNSAGNWVSNANTSGNANDELVFQPGTGVIIRKYQTSGGATSFWTYDLTN